MASVTRRVMHYLGLGPDEEYEDDYDDLVEEPEPAPSRVGEPAGAVRPLHRDQAPPPPRQPVVRPVQPVVNATPHVVTITSFNDAQECADRFKEKQPVIVNLQGADRDLARRLIDFASGLCYALNGAMKKVGNQVYLLTPTDVEVSAEDRRRLQERGLHDS